MRCVHEASMHEHNSFITLTYEEQHLPDRNKLEHKDVQDFLKRVRKKYNVRYYMAGEYGPENGRPHYHMCLFGHDWNDKIFLKTTPSGEKIYTSAELSKFWPWGFTSTADVTFESAAYVARYCLQKITGDMAEEHYKRYDYLGEYTLPPEYNRMSLKPGIGAEWLKKYMTDVYTYDYVIINGVETRPPKYYDEMYKVINEEHFEQLKDERVKLAQERYFDNTDVRLADKEKVTQAKLNNLKRGKVQ